MKRSKAAAFFLGLAALALCGCGSSGEGSGTAQTNESLTLCVDEYINGIYGDGFVEFQKKYPDVKLNVEVYDNLMAGMERVNKQLMAGEGPDLILMRCYGTADVYKMMREQAFAPLDEFMENDSEWNAQDYVQALVDAGVYEDKHMVMPLSYNTPIVITSKKNVENTGLSLDSCNDLLTFLQEAEQFYELDGMERVMGECWMLGPYPQYLAHNFIDYGDGTLGIDEQTLKQACEAYRSFFAEEDEGAMLPAGGYYGVGEGVGDGRMGFGIPLNADYFMSVLQGAADNDTPVLWPVKNERGEINASIMDYAGIRAGSENRQNAWNLLKILMGEKVQADIAKAWQYYPVRRSALEEEIEQLWAQTGAHGVYYMELGEQAEDLLQQYKAAVMNPGNGIFVTNICTVKFKRCMKPFYKGEDSCENCIAEFQEFLRAYLAE